MRIKGLKRLEVHSDANYDASLISVISHFELEDVWLDMQPDSVENLRWKPWMEKMKSLKVGNKQIVAPK